MNHILKIKSIFFLFLLVLLLSAAYFYLKSGAVSKEPGLAKAGLKEICRDDDNKFYCWEDLISSALKTKGLDAAFEVLAGLYSSEPVFASECHSYAHKLGEAAYDKFNKHEDLDLTPKTSYCGYGFYHGFMETLFRSGGNIDQAKEFCAYVGKILMAETNDAEGACYHGIGHGSVDGSDPRAWGDPRKMIEPGMKLCRTILGEFKNYGDYFYRCITGAYNAVEILSTDPKYKLQAIIADPFWLCPSQPELYKEACYTNMLPALLRFTNNDFAKSAGMIEKIEEVNDSYGIRSIVVLGLFHEFIRVNLNYPGYNAHEGVKLCRLLNERSRIPCTEGLSGGHMKYGEPDREYIKGLAFCGSDILREDERDRCYKHILSRLRIWYSAKEAKSICDGVDKEYRDKYCSNG